MVSNYFFPAVLGTIACLSSSIASANPTLPAQNEALYRAYQQARGQAEHQQLYQKLQAYARENTAQYSSDLKLATHLWLDWHALREWLAPQLSLPWITQTEALAHRDPVAALKLLAQSGPGSTPEQQALSLLLQGFISNHLDGLWLAERRPAQALSAFDYARQHPNEYQTGELCYGVNYSGAAWQRVEKLFPATRWAEAAAYLSMQQQACGECEGEFACYLARDLAPVETFLAKYPQSGLAERVLQLALLRLQLHFVQRSASKDFLSQSEDYRPQDIATILVSFESKLKSLPDALQLRLKLGLLPYYLALNQTSNSQRVLAWLADQGHTTAYQQALATQASYPKLALYLQAPSIISPTLIQLNWRWRSGSPPQELQVWRANQSDFSDAQAVSAAIPAQQFSFNDSKVKPGKAYWYQLRSVDRSASQLSHTAYQEIDPIAANLREGTIQSWLIDKERQRLYFQSALRLSERRLIKAWQVLPLDKLPADADTLSYFTETADQTSLLDFSNQTVLEPAASSSWRIQDLRLLQAASEGSATVISNKAGKVYRVNSHAALLSPDQQGLYFWKPGDGLWRSDLQGLAQQPIAKEKSSADGSFSMTGLQPLDKDELLITGHWKTRNQTKLGWYLWRQSRLQDVSTTYTAHYATAAQAFAADLTRQGVWLVSKEQNTASLLGWQGQPLRTLSEKDFPVHLQGRIERVLANSRRQEVYFATASQIFRLTAANKMDLIWQQALSPSGEKGSAQILRKQWQPLQTRLQRELCHLQAPWLGLDLALCDGTDNSWN